MMLSLVMIGTIVLAGGMSMNATAYATGDDDDDDEHAYDAPFHQYEDGDGVPINAVQCNEPRELYIRNSDTPVCMTESTYESLLGYGLDLQLPAPQSYTDIIYGVVDANESDVKRVVDATIQLYNSDKSKAFIEVNLLADNIVPHYPFILDPETKGIVAHGASQSRIGSISALLTNYANIPYETTIERLNDSDGIWVTYTFLDPVTGDEELKHSWIVLHDGYIFGAGLYHELGEEVEHVIGEVIELYDKEGVDGINSLDAHDARFNPRIIDPATNVIVGDYANPDNVNTVTVQNSDVDNSELLAALEAAGDKGISRYILEVNEETGIDDQTRVLYVLHDGYIFSAEYQYSASEKVMGVVERAIELYKVEGEHLFEDIDAQADQLNPHYPFVVDYETKLIASHGGFPDRVVGTQSRIMSDFADRPTDQIVEELKDGEGIWVQYVYPVPGTDFEESKRTYLQLHDGYVFASGYYYSVFTAIP